MVAKQVAEKYFKQDVELISGHYIEKIQVNPYAFTNTAADYFIQNKDFDILVEVKQIALNQKAKPIFKLSRLTQEFRLNEWKNRFERNKSFIFFVWWGGTKKKSLAYLVPFKHWIVFRNTWYKESIDSKEFSEEFLKFRVCMDGNSWILDFK